MPGVGDMLGWSRGPGSDPRMGPPTPRSSSVANLNSRYQCNISCKWASKKPSCNRLAKSLNAYFKEHGEFGIVYREYAHKYPECPMFEVK